MLCVRLYMFDEFSFIMNASLTCFFRPFGDLYMINVGRHFIRLKKVLQNTDEKHQCSIALLCCYAPLFRHADIQFFSLSEDLDNKRNSFCAILSIDYI